MEKRAILAVVLSVAVFFLFSVIMGPQKRNNTIGQQNEKQSITTNNQLTVPPQTSLSQVLQTQLPQDNNIKNITVDTPLYSAEFSSRGASLKKITLKKYREHNNSKASSVVLGADSDPSVYEFATRATGFNLADSINYTSDETLIKSEGQKPRQLIFNYVSNQGFTVRKIYTLTDSSYNIKLETQIFNNLTTPLVGTIQHILTYPAAPKVKDNRFDTAGAYLFADASLASAKIKDIATASKKYDKNVQWAGFADKYFLSAIMADKDSIASVELKKNNAGFMEEIVSTPQITVNPGASASISHNLFIGPKDIDILKSQGNSLVQSLDLGWFTVLAKPMLYSLKFFYGIVGNYGLAIIIITIILKVFFFPLTHKSYKSMKGMQKIQPEMAKLKEKYKNDRDGMNKAVMELYRDHKVNPLGGCLPMFVQIPVFFALYKALMFSIELRHEPFFLWVTDLSDKDPYYVTPIIMGITMFIQQKMTPSQMDPIQQKMMLALPVVFTFMFLSFPSGLVLYWLVNNILTIAQQIYINKTVN